MTKAIIDRFEGDYAILEIEDVMSPIKRSDIPEDAKEGDVLTYADKQWQIDHEATARLKNDIQALADEVWE